MQPERHLRSLLPVALAFVAGIYVGSYESNYTKARGDLADTTSRTHEALGRVQFEAEAPEASRPRISSDRTPTPQDNTDVLYLSTQAAAALGAAGIYTRVHIPPWVFAPPDSASGQTEEAGPEEMALAAAASVSQSSESQWAMQQFFWGRRGGTVLELGALDGLRFSNSFAFEARLGWRAVNVEASPASFARLVGNRPDALNLNLAVCAAPPAGAPPPLLHYLTGPSPCCHGIWEFMSAPFRKQWYPGVTDANVGEPRHARGVNSTAVHCGPLAAYLALLGVGHIDFWSLDVEGAELQVLRGFDLGRVTVDVIAVEADGGNLAQEAAVREHLQERGYELLRPAEPARHNALQPAQPVVCANGGAGETPG